MSSREADPRARASRTDRPAGGSAGAALLPATGTLGHEKRVALFCDRVDDYRADVRRVSAPELGPAIAAALGGRRVAVPPGLPWRPDGVDVVIDDGLTPPSWTLSTASSPAARSRSPRRGRSCSPEARPTGGAR